MPWQSSKEKMVFKLYQYYVVPSDLYQLTSSDSKVPAEFRKMQIL